MVAQYIVEDGKMLFLAGFSVGFFFGACCIMLIYKLKGENDESQKEG